ncbi:hypothetical protein [Oceanithermus sp.]
MALIVSLVLSWAFVGFWIGWTETTVWAAVVSAGLVALRYMPCGKAGMLVFFATGTLVALSSMRAEIGETAFYALLAVGWTLLFLAYRRFALRGGCSGTACRAD